MEIPNALTRSLDMDVTPPGAGNLRSLAAANLLKRATGERGQDRHAACATSRPGQLTKYPLRPARITGHGHLPGLAGAPRPLLAAGARRVGALPGGLAGAPAVPAGRGGG